jgi:hypothetical protein
MPEYGQGTGTGAVVFLRTVGKNSFEQIVILVHGNSSRDLKTAEPNALSGAIRQASPNYTREMWVPGTRSRA